MSRPTIRRIDTTRTIDHFLVTVQAMFPEALLDEITDAYREDLDLDATEMDLESFRELAEMVVGEHEGATFQIIRLDGMIAR